MRLLQVFPMLLVLAGCTPATASRVDYRTFQIDGPGIPGGSTAPNRRVAARVCPDGYRVLNSISRNNTPDGYWQGSGVYTTWTIRCL